jgi:hypothetical protein
VDNLTRLHKLKGVRGQLTRIDRDGHSWEAPYTIEKVMPPDHIPEGNDPRTFNALISASSFLVLFDEGILIDGSNTRLLSGSEIVFSPEGERALAAVVAERAGKRRFIGHGAERP